MMVVHANLQSSLCKYFNCFLLLLPLLTPDIDCRRRRRETFFIHSPLLHDLIILFCSSLPHVLELHVCNLLLFLFSCHKEFLLFFCAVASLNFMCVIIIPNYYFSPPSLTLFHTHAMHIFLSPE